VVAIAAFVAIAGITTITIAVSPVAGMVLATVAIAAITIDGNSVLANARISHQITNKITFGFAILPFDTIHFYTHLKFTIQIQIFFLILKRFKFKFSKTKTRTEHTLPSSPLIL
jgi:hypothetical protein